MLGSTFKCSVVEDGCKIARLPGLQHCKALPNCSPWQPEVSKLQEFPRHCPSKAAELQTWQSKSAKLQALQALVANRLGGAAPPLQGFAKLQPLPTCQGTAQAKVPNYRPGKVAKLPTFHTVGPAPTLQGFPSKSAKLQGPGKVAKLPTCKGSNTAGLQNYSPCQPCQPAKVSTLRASHLLQGLPNYK